MARPANSVIGSANLISRVYFPRLSLPNAAVMVAFVDFFISFVILVGLMIWYGFIPGWLILLLPAFAAMIERPTASVRVCRRGCSGTIACSNGKACPPLLFPAALGRGDGLIK